MRIAICHNLPSGGAKRHTYEQVRRLAQRGHELVEFAPSTADLSYCSLAPFVKRQRIFNLEPARQMRRRLPLLTPYFHAVQGIRTLRRTADADRAIAQEIDAADFDVVLVKDCQIVMNPYVLRYLLTNSLFQCHHGLRHRAEARRLNEGEAAWGSGRLKRAYYAPARALYQSKFRSDEQRNIRSATRVLTNSAFSESLIAREYGVEARVIYPGIDTEKFCPLSRGTSDYVLSVGALIYTKGHRFIVEALSLIPDQRRPALLIAANSVDPVEEKIVQKLAAARGVTLRIETIADDNRLVEVYSRARAFLYAPIQEALGLAPLEALACGTPVIAVAEGGVRETIIDGVTGWLVDRNAAAFAERLETTLGEVRASQAMARAGREHVIRDWNWASAVDRLEAELHQVTAA